MLAKQPSAEGGSDSLKGFCFAEQDLTAEAHGSLENAPLPCILPAPLAVLRVKYFRKMHIEGGARDAKSYLELVALSCQGPGLGRWATLCSVPRSHHSGRPDFSGEMCWERSALTASL